MSIRHREVAVAVIFDPASQKFLLCNNKRWNGYAFPMKHVEQATSQSLADAAFRSLDDWDVPATFPNATLTPLDYVVEAMISDAVQQLTVYEYHVFDIDIHSSLPSPLHPDLRLYSYDELQAAINVTASTKEIARSIVEDRKVAVAILTRQPALGSGSTKPRSGREYLVVHNKNHGYFFPSTRIKGNKLPAESALEAARIDLGYGGPLRVVAQAQEVPALKSSTRFGSGTRRFYYHLCLIEATGVDPSQPGNAIQNSLDEIGAAFGSASIPYSCWMDENALRTSMNISTSMPEVLLTALQLGEQQDSSRA